MSNFGFGYGSQWHLLRYLGYHRQELNKRVLAQTGGESIEWLDFPFSEWSDPLWQDREFVGLEFVTDHIQAPSAWARFWPQQGSSHNWDAIAQVSYGSQKEWLLVEAKAHIGEMKSHCKAKSRTSLATIQAAFDIAKHSFGADTVASSAWLTPYYQYCNRLAMLHFLEHECQPSIPARLIFLYFSGDTNPRQECPTDEPTWQRAIDSMHQTIGITKSSDLMRRVHHVVLPVNPMARRHRFPVESIAR